MSDTLESQDSLISIVEDAVQDLQTPAEPIEVDTPDEPEEVVEAPEEAPTEPVEEVPPTPVAQATVPTPTPSEVKPEPKKYSGKLSAAEFEKLVGVPPQYPGGRENRIPYSRVKKITDKATKMAVETARAEWEQETSPKVGEFETKLKAAESELNTYRNWDDTLANKPEKFLQMLERHPVYTEWFQQVRQAFALAQGVNPAQATGKPQADGDPRPEPDQTLADGTAVYSMEGLDSLMAWQARQIENKVTRQVEARYKPLEESYAEQQKRVAAERVYQEQIPRVRAQIEDARTWPLFNESEEEITKVLQEDPRISLDAAYRKVVFPKLATERNKIRTEVLQEVRQAPRSTSVAATSAKSTPVQSGDRSLEDIIRDQIQGLK